MAQLPVVISTVKPGMHIGVDDHGGEVEDALIPITVVYTHEEAAHGVKNRGKQPKDSDSA